MIKNQSATVPFFLYNPTDGAPATGATSISVYISKDGGTPALATNSAVEVSAATAPGIYKIVLTAAELNADIVVLTFSHATAAAMPLTITPEAAVDVAGALSTYGAAKPADVATALSNYGAAKPADIPTAAQNAAAVDVAGALSTYGAAKPADVASALTNYGAAKPADIPTAAQTAAAVLQADVSTAQGEAGALSLATLILAQFNSSIDTDGRFTVYKTDGTILTQRQVATSGTAEPVIGVGEVEAVEGEGDA